MNESQLQRQTHIIDEVELERDRAEAMASVSSRMQALQSIYIDISDHVSRASTSLNSIENHLLESVDDTGEATREIKITASRQFRDYFRRVSVGAFFALVVIYTIFL